MQEVIEKTKDKGKSGKVDLADIDIMEYELPTNENLDLLKRRHSSAHIMAMAVQKIRPDIQCTIGPATENGFFYDFYVPGEPLTEKDLKPIKKEMDKIIKQNLPFVREEVSREEAKARITAQNESYKLEILDSITTEPITIYHIGDEWWDLCAGPHVESTKEIDKNALEVQSLAGAYWRGSEENDMLTRIYGTAWENKQQMKVFKKRLAEAKLRDHRVIGKALDLFSIQETAGGGLVFWHPKGTQIRRLIEDFWKDAHVEDGYELLTTPHMASLDLWKTSGHHDFYKDDMFKPMEVEGNEYQLKPMNCPFHCLVYKDSPRSYRDLPFRWAELGTVYRYERSGTLSGLMRVRGFTQDDAHIFCLPDQLEDEIVGVLDLTEKVLNKFGFNKYQVMLSTRPDKSVGSDEIWDKATKALVGALERKGWSYSIDEGGGAFYGPKIDMKIKDAVGRSWQCSTIQCDFNLPERFELEYKDSDNTMQRPIMVHRAIFGSLERFFGILIENTAGIFPLWIAPVQLRLLPVTRTVMDYCYEVKKAAAKLGLRVEVASDGQTIGKMIKVGRQEKLPLLAIVGEKELEERTLSMRSRQVGELGAYDLDQILGFMKKAVDDNVELHEIEGITIPEPTPADK
jgi:threonyl-tRNA synthetase